VGDRDAEQNGPAGSRSMVCKTPSIRYIAVPESPCSAAGFRLAAGSSKLAKSHYLAQRFERDTRG
jgi:hypothetical protein